MPKKQKSERHEKILARCRRKLRQVASKRPWGHRCYKMRVVEQIDKNGKSNWHLQIFGTNGELVVHQENVKNPEAAAALGYNLVHRIALGKFDLVTAGHAVETSGFYQ